MHNQLIHAPCGFVTLNHESIIIDLNETFCRWTGVDQQIVGAHFDTILSAANKMMFHSYFYPTINVQGEVNELYLTLKHQDGTLSPYLMNARKFGEGTEERIDCVFVQMKKRIDYEMELRATKAQIQDAYEAKALAFERLEEIYATIEQKQQELLEINTGLVRVTNTDKLTGLYNRKYYYEMLAQNFLAYYDDSIPVSLVILDIDYFKRVNDTYGHLVGDDVLVHLASLLQQNCREQDIPCRYGGEEFIVILPNTVKEEAVQVGKRLNELVQQTDWPTIQHLTISVGISTIYREDTEDALLDRADKALYFAKQNGRNQVAHFDDIRIK